QMLGVKQAVGWDAHDSAYDNLARIFREMTHGRVLKSAAALGAELYTGLRPHAPVVKNIDPSLREQADQFCRLVREHSHQFKLASKHYGESMISRQLVQARLADSATWLHAWACTLSKLDRDLRAGGSGARFDRDRAAAMHFMDMAAEEIERCFRGLFDNTDDSARAAAEAALRYSNELPNDRFSIPEASPVAKGTGRKLKQQGIKQFPGSGEVAGGNGELSKRLPLVPSPGPSGEE